MSHSQLSLRLINPFAWGSTFFAVCLGAACAGEEESEIQASSKQASVDFALMASSFAGGSARICGTRPPVSGALNCAVALPFVPGSDDPPEPALPCACYDFNAEGVLVDALGNPARATGLCPSTAAPPADWTFEYFVYAGPGCTGTQLNDGMHDFVCYDAQDLATRAHPNQSIEALQPGVNVNHILCVSATAAKSWNFESCTDISTTADIMAGVSRYGCGCKLVSGRCSCGPGGLTPDDLEMGCDFDASCNIRCAAP